MEVVSTRTAHTTADVQWDGRDPIVWMISMSVCNSPVLMEVLALTSRARTSVDVLWAGPATTVK